MTADQAIASRARLHSNLDPIPVLAADVGERLAIRDPLGEWTVQAVSGAVRLYLRTGPESHVSRYVWHYRDTDAVIDHLLSVKPLTPDAI